MLTPAFLTRLTPGDLRAGPSFIPSREADLKREHLKAVQQFANRELSADDFIVRGMMVCNSARDYYNSRFTLGALGEIAELLPGAPVMRAHDYGTTPVGRFFHAEVVQIEKRGLPKRDSSWVKALYYDVNDEAGQARARMVDLGIWKEGSIGWRCVGADCAECGDPIWACPHIPGDIYDRGICEYQFSGITSALEVSHVFRGGQKDTSTFVPEGTGEVAESAQMHRAGLIVDMEWSRIGAFKRSHQTLEEFMAGGKRAVGWGTFFAKPGDRGNTQRVECSKDRFESVGEAARWCRENDFRADRRHRAEGAYVFEQFSSKLAEPDTERTRNLDEGVQGIAVKRKAPDKEGERVRMVTEDELERFFATSAA